MKLNSLLNALAALFRRLDLNNPPTSVGGIQKTRSMLAYRLDLNHPPTPVGGISEFFTLVTTELKSHAR